MMHELYDLFDQTHKKCYYEVGQVHQQMLNFNFLFMNIEIIENILGLLERTSITGKEVPIFNKVVGALLEERQNLIKKLQETPQ